MLLLQITLGSDLAQITPVIKLRVKRARKPERCKLRKIIIKIIWQRATPSNPKYGCKLRGGSWQNYVRKLRTKHGFAIYLLKTRNLQHRLYVSFLCYQTKASSHYPPARSQSKPLHQLDRRRQAPLNSLTRTFSTFLAF